ncbi:MAG: NAD(+)/NADH kinase [Thermoleophilaceae bacterium]|nr:NAD(+)/NADH kinase [Thermoleophilaceae bacterium]
MGLFSRASRRRSAELPLDKDAGDKRKMLLIVNPYASTVSKKMKNLVIYALQSRYEVEAIETVDRNHATDICKRAIAGNHDIVVAFGGDGTANEVANGMAGTDIPVAFLPGGLTSVIARTIGMPTDTIDATEHLLTLADRWEPFKIDLGEANGRKFLFTAGAGFDAEIVKTCEASPTMKARFGQNFYFVVALRVVIGKYLMRKPRMTTRSGDFEKDAVVTVVQNTAPFTYFGDRPIEICEDADLRSGSLSMAVLDRVNPFDFLPLFVRLLSKKLHVAKNRHLHIVEGFQEATIHAKDGKRIPLQVDGDYIGDFAEITIRACPDALTVIA